MMIRFGLLAVFCLIFSGNLFAQLLKPEVITIEQGLSQGMIYDLHQTRDGFLWVATKDGLNRYDGYNFKVFSSDPFNPYSVAENTVTALFEDSRGWLWVGTESKGVDLYDPKTERFHHFTLSYHQKKSSTSYDILSIKEAADGAIWAMQRGGGLICIPVPKEWTRKLPESTELSGYTQPYLFPLDISDGTMVTFNIVDDQHLMLATDARQYLLDIPTKTSKVIPYPTQIGTVYSLSYDRGDQQGNYWACNENAVFRYENNQVTAFPIPKGYFKERAIVAQYGKGEVWVMIEKQMWHLTSGSKIDFSNPDWVMDELPTALLTDRNGNIWTGTLGYGIRKFNPRKKSFHPGAAGTTIWGLWSDKNGKYYVKVVNKIYPYDPVSGKVGAQPAFAEAPTRLLDLIITPAGDLWTVGRGEAENGIGTLLHYHPDGTFDQKWDFKYNAYVHSRLLNSKSGKIWISGSNGQLVCFDPVTSVFTYFDYTRDLGAETSLYRVMAMVEDGNGVIWMGMQQGLIKAIPNGQKIDFQLIQANRANPEGISNNSVSCLLPDPDDPAGTLWIGTKGGGINVMDLKTGKCRHLTHENGLPNNVVYGILPGVKHEMWCSTNRGLAKMTRRADEDWAFDITNFSAANGLQDNEFNSQAFSKSLTGELLFGGVKGLNHFKPESISLDTTPPPVYIVGLEINHRPVIFGREGSVLQSPVENLRVLQLDYDENNVSFEFAALDFTDPKQNRYRYWLEGLDGDWVETKGNRFAHFTHLAPGTYRFRVQGSNGEGGWKETPESITVVVHPPWWQSTLAYIVYAGLLFFAGYQAYQFQIRRVQLREQLAFEHRETERIKAVEQMKTNFFSNVTHEFRTPLTLMLEPLRQLQDNPQDPKLTEKLALVDRNSKRLLAMVNQLLDLAKLEHGGMQLDLDTGDMAGCVHQTFTPFLHLAEKKQIQLTYKAPAQPVIAVFDQQKVELVLNNLLSNALKFTPPGGKVAVELLTESPAESRGTPFICLVVKDNGPGIPEEMLGRIFERFYQVDGAHVRAAEGTGIGLALSKELSHLMGGKLEVDSQPGNGATFTFRLPWTTYTQSAPALKKSETAFTDSRLADQELPVVVVVEDNPDIREMIRLSLGGQWQVVETSNGKEGLQKIEEVVPDMVISDLMMPEMDGYEVCQAIKINEITAHIPIILLTARSTMDSRLKGLQFGADDYLTKPFNATELMVRMNNLLESRRRLRQLFSQVTATNPAIVEEKSFFSAPDNEFLRRFTLLIDENLSDETLGVEEFANKMFISRVQLHRKLKGLTGQSATDYIRNYRLDRAWVMLKNKEGLVSEIAYKVGFINEKYFSTVFKEKFGVSPSNV